MPHALVSRKLGTFVGLAQGVAFFTRIGSGGAISAQTYEDREAAEKQALNLAAVCGYLEIAEVASGHWLDLLEAGLDIGELGENDLRDVLCDNALPI